MTASQPNNPLTVDPSVSATDSMTTEAATSPVKLKKVEVKDSTSNATASSNPKSVKRGVSFDKIEIREYSRCLGINPATTHGPSLSLDWLYNIAGTYDVEEYEKSRPARRETQQMLLPGSLREEILLEHSDVTRKQISNAVADNKVARNRRQASLAFQEYEDWVWLGETIMRRYRRMRSGISKKKEQQLLWENAQRVLESQAAKSAPSSESGSEDGSTQGTDSDTRPTVSSRAREIAPSNQ